MRSVICVADRLADPATARYLVTIRVGPLTDLRELVRVTTLRGGATAGAVLTAADLPSRCDVVGERLAQRLGVVVREVDLVVVAIKREGHGATLAFVDGVAGQVIDQMRGNFLRHRNAAFHSEIALLFWHTKLPKSCAMTAAVEECPAGRDGSGDRDDAGRGRRSALLGELKQQVRIARFTARRRVNTGVVRPPCGSGATISQRPEVDGEGEATSSAGSRRTCVPHSLKLKVSPAWLMAAYHGAAAVFIVLLLVAGQPLSGVPIWWSF